MKEMNQYQKALEEIVKSSCPVAMKSKKYCNECIIHKSCNCIAKDYIDTLQKLINEQTKNTSAKKKPSIKESV